MIGYYYLHSESKDLIYKPACVVDSEPGYFDGPFVQKFWRSDSEDRFDAWQICVEASVLGARKDRIAELVKKWGLTDEDGQHFLKKAKMSVKRDGDQWCVAHNDDTDSEGFVNLQEDQVGFGYTIFDALVDYAKQGQIS